MEAQVGSIRAGRSPVALALGGLWTCQAGEVQVAREAFGRCLWISRLLIPPSPPMALAPVLSLFSLQFLDEAR